MRFVLEFVLDLGLGFVLEFVLDLGLRFVLEFVLDLGLEFVIIFGRAQNRLSPEELRRRSDTCLVRASRRRDQPPNSHLLLSLDPTRFLAERFGEIDCYSCMCQRTMRWQARVPLRHDVCNLHV
jgi:hypothetical protein